MLGLKSADIWRHCERSTHRFCQRRNRWNRVGDSLTLAERGHDVAFTYRNNKGAAEQLSEQIRAHGVRAHSYSLDLTDELSISAAVNDAVDDLAH